MSSTLESADVADVGECRKQPALPDSVPESASKRLRCCNCQSLDQVFIASTSGPRCTPCFIDQLQRSFRYAVQRGAMLSHGERVAVALSGGPASLALLELLLHLRRGVPTKKGKIRPKHFDLIVLHVPVPASCGGLGTSGAVALGALVEKRYHLTMDTMSPELFLNALQERMEALKADASDNVSLLCRDSSQHSLLFADTIAASLETMARQRGCRKLFLGTTITRAAVITIARVATGQVHRLCHEITVEQIKMPTTPTGEQPAALEALRILRPLREVSTREAVRYLRCRGCTNWITPAQPWWEETPESAAERFIWRASETRPATSFSVVHSIERTMRE